MRILFFTSLLSLFSTLGFSQTNYWQQEAHYQIDVDFDITNHQFNGQQTITYINHSPDTLEKVFIHLYFNAFQPGSAMDVRSRNIKDPDKRVGSRIAELKPNEIGFHQVKSLTQNADSLSFHVEGTVLEAQLSQALKPGDTASFELSYHSQVPVQIRRSGRNNKEGIEYTMTQWYPKMAEYDKHGWHATPYIGREFHGVFGTFDVKINIDKNYVLAGTGTVQNKQAVGHGYQDPDTPLEPVNGEKLTWHFKAENVHDFAWAADPDYQHDEYRIVGGPTIRFFYQTDTLADQWKKIQPQVAELFEVMSAKFGEYPYPEFSVIQGGDGGMEYPTCTMIVGHGSYKGKLGLIAHEAFHNWYYGVLASNESKYPWMDEGFTSYTEHIVMDSVLREGSKNPLEGYYKTYRRFSQSPLHEPMSTHADHFNTNAAYSISSYVKGAVFLHQLSYIVGDSVFSTGMKKYFNQWKFKHPDPDDFKRVMEKVSGLELDWYLENWVNTTKTIDYGVSDLKKRKKQTEIVLTNHGTFPMPVEVEVSYTDGSKERFYIPIAILRGEKTFKTNNSHTLLPDWNWTAPEYVFTIDRKLKEIQSVTLDPTGRVADVQLENNTFNAEK